MCEFNVFNLLAFCSHRKHIENLNNRIYVMSHTIRSTNDRRLTFAARNITNHNVRFFRVVTLKQYGLLLQQGNEQSDDSQQMECEVLTDSGQTVEDSSGHSGTEPTDCKVRGNDREWTDCRRQQWT